MDTKACKKCEKELPLDSFYKGKTYKGGYRPKCKECSSEAYYFAKRDEKRQKAAQYRLENREKVSEAARKHREENAEKIREYYRQWYAANSEKKRESVKLYRQDRPDQYRGYRHTRRVRLAEGECSLTNAQWEEVKLRYKHKCAYCGKKPEKLTMDHVIPISKGGSHSADNIVPACLTCNCSKQANPAPLYVQTMLVA